MKIVAVSQRVDFVLKRDEIRDAVDQRLLQFIMRCGGIPIPVPNILSDIDYFNNWFNVVNPDAIILSGGNDLGACLKRDQTEYRLLDYAEKNDLPVLGICRGMQMMGVRAGVQLKPVEKHINVRHSLTGHLSGQVNSYHALSLSELPPNFVALAYSEDGEIEAMSHKDRPWEGWMWHPEREKVLSSDDINRLIGLLT